MTDSYGWKDLSNLGKFGVISQGFGAIGGAVGSFYAASAEKYKTKSLALSLEHKRDMALFNQRMKESQAQHIQRAYNKQIQIATLKQGSAKSSARASFAARGIQMGVGSTKDAFVSSEILAKIDKMTMNSNKVRATQNKRLEAVGVGIRGDMYGVGASNMFATASSISPFMNMSSSLLTGGANFISSLPPGMLRS
tara:strand:+ start:718 stop:1302 length:585 start_codon:yes stop_codon:yes gene_type:complete